MFVYNYHTHTARCGHATGTDEEYVLAAIEAGYKVLGFSDHAPYRDYPLPRSHMDWSQLVDYLDSLNYLKEKYKDQIKIVIGLESEYYPDCADDRKELHDKVDFFLLGQHYARPDGTCSYFKLNTEEETRLYCEQVLEGLDSGLFTYLCHPDVFMNRQTEFTEVCAETAHRIAQKCVVTNTPVEVNIRGITKGLKPFVSGERYFYPHREFWEIMSCYPLMVVTGIDAHAPADLLDKKSIELAFAQLEDLDLDYIKEPFI